jgi:DNA-binding LytR/AlgR family response regulator
VNNGKLILKTYSEVFFINLDRVIYFQADDHYSFVFYSEKEKFMLPFGLSTIEQSLADSDFSKSFVRLGRKYIVNVNKVFKVNVFKQQLFLEGKDTNVVLNIPKPVLAEFVELV